QNRVVDDQVVLGGASSIFLEQRDAGGMAVVQQVVSEYRVLHTVAVDARAATLPVVVYDVVLDQSIGDDAVAPLGDVSVELDAGVSVAPDRVSADDGVVRAVGDVDAVLFDGPAGHVVLDEDVLGETGEDAPGSHSVDVVVAYHNPLVLDRTDPGPRDRAIVGD